MQLWRLRNFECVLYSNLLSALSHLPIYVPKWARNSDPKSVASSCPRTTVLGLFLCLVGAADKGFEYLTRLVLALPVQR
jgi:hypothetical protein